MRHIHLGKGLTFSLIRESPKICFHIQILHTIHRLILAPVQGKLSSDRTVTVLRLHALIRID